MSARAFLADPELLDRSATADVRAVTRAGCAETERAAVGLARRVVGSAECFRLVVSGRTSKNEDRCLFGVAFAAHLLQRPNRRTIKQGAWTGRRGFASSGTSNQLRSIKKL